MVGSLSLFGGGNEVHLIPDRLVQAFVFQSRHIPKANMAIQVARSSISDTPV